MRNRPDLGGYLGPHTEIKVFASILAGLAGGYIADSIVAGHFVSPLTLVLPPLDIPFILGFGVGTTAMGSVFYYSNKKQHTE